MNEKYMKDFNGEKIFSLEYDKETLKDMVLDKQEEIERLNNIIKELEKALNDEIFEIDFFTQDKYVEAVRNTCNKYLDLLKELKGSDKE